MRCRRSKTAASAAASPPALLEAMQRQCAEILTRLRKSKNSVWFNSPVDVEGLKMHDYTDTRVRFAERARRRPWRDEEATRKGRRGCLPFLLGIGEMLLGIEKKYREKGEKNQSVGASFFTINPLY